MKKLFASLLTIVAIAGAFALVLPPSVAQAKECVICPQIAINCGPCANLIPQTCNRCQYCKQIPGCHA
jgi:hypothetical protein